MKRFLLFLTCSLMLFGVTRAAETINSADFQTMNQGKMNTGYNSYTSTAGWKVANCALLLYGTGNANGYYDIIPQGQTAPTMNGKTSAKGTITSPQLTNGLGKLSFNYGLCFADTKIGFTVNIKQNNQIVKTETVSNNSATKLTEYSFECDVNLKGDFVIEIINNCPSNKDGNGDRLSVWNLSWTNYSGDDTPPTPAVWNHLFSTSYSVEVGQTKSLFNTTEACPPIKYTTSYENVVKEGKVEINDETNEIKGVEEGEIFVTASWGDENWESNNYTFKVDIAPASQQGGGTTTGWVLVKNLSDLNYGDRVVIACTNGKDSYALKKDNQQNYRPTTDATINDGILTLKDDMMIFEVVNTNNSSYPYAFKTTNYGGNSQGYIGNSANGNNCSVSTSISTGFAASVSLDNNSKATITFNNSNAQKVLVYNNNSPRFACYNPSNITSAYTYPQLYKYQGSTDETTVTKPVITCENNKVSISCETDGSVIYYTINGETPSNTSTKYEKAFDISAKTTVKAIAYVDDVASDVVEATFFYIPEQPMTVDQALSLIKDGYTEEATVKGYITEIEEVSPSYGNATYYIADTKEANNVDALYIYRGKWKNGENFTTEDQIEVGGEITVKGNLLNYVKNGTSTPEMATGNVVVEYTAPEKEEPTKVENPVLSIESGSTVKVGQTLTISCATEGALLFGYVGEEELENVPAPYTYTFTDDDISVNDNFEVSVLATKEGLEDSEEVEATYKVIPDLSADQIEAHYSIVFPGNETGGDSSTVISNPSYAAKVSKGQEFIDSFTGVTQVYNGKTDFGLKFGSSNTKGKLTINLSEFGKVVPTKVVLSCALYDNTSETQPTIMLNDKSSGSLNLSKTEFKEVVYNFEGAENKLEALVIEQTAGKRFYINGIDIYYKALPFSVSENNWDLEWDNEGNELAVNLTADFTANITPAEALDFELVPAWGGATEETVMDYSEGNFETLTEVPGLYDVVIRVKTLDYAINGTTAVTVGQANLYPSHTGLTLSYLNNLGVNRTFPVSVDGLTYQFETSSDNADWIHDYCKTPNISHEIDDVEIWYNLHGLDEVEVPEPAPAPAPQEVVKRAADLTENGFTKVSDDGTIDLTKLAYADESAAPQLSFVLKMNGAETPLFDADNSKSTALVNITRDNNVNTGVEAIGAEEGDAEYFTLQGVKVQNPEKGIFIKVTNGNAVKVVL